MSAPRPTYPAGRPESLTRYQLLDAHAQWGRKGTAVERHDGTAWEWGPVPAPARRLLDAMIGRQAFRSPEGWTGYYGDLMKGAGIKSYRTLRRAWGCLFRAGWLDAPPPPATCEEGRWGRAPGVYRLQLPRWARSRTWRAAPQAANAQVTQASRPGPSRGLSLDPLGDRPPSTRENRSGAVVQTVHNPAAILDEVWSHLSPHRRRLRKGGAL